MTEGHDTQTAISDKELAKVRRNVNEGHVYEPTSRFITRALLARLDAAEAALLVAAKARAEQHEIFLENTEARLADVEAESAAKDAVIEAARAHLAVADGLSLGASEEARNREVAAATTLANALRALNPKETGE